MKGDIRKVFLCLISLSVMCLVVAAGKSESYTNNGEDSGYLVNDMGQTYGPDIKWSNKEPDLILVESSDGVLGYVKKDDLNGVSPKTPEEALSYQIDGRYIDVYLCDGKTIVGEFYIGN